MNDCASVCYFRERVFTEIVCSIGDGAKNAFHFNPENTVFDAKRLIGRKFDDPELQKDMKHWYFVSSRYPR